MKGRIINYLKSIGINADGIKEYKKDEIFVYIGNARIEFIKGTENGIYSIRWIGIEPPKKIPSKIFYMDFNKELVLFWEKDGNLHRKNAEPATLSFNMQTGKLTSYSFFEDGKVVPVNATQEDIQRNYEFLFEEYRNLLRYIFNGKGEIKQKKTQEPKRNQIDMIELDEVRRRIKLLKEDRNLDLELMDAAKKGDLDKVKNLIEQGADIHAERDHALRIAAKRGYFDIVKYLVEHGADIHAVNDCTLRLAVENGDLDMVKYLVEHGADIHVFKEGPLFWAVKYGYLDIVKYLVENGADIHVLDYYALTSAALYGYFDIIEYLLDNGVDETAIKDDEVYKQWKKKQVEDRWVQVDLDEIPIKSANDQSESERTKTLELNDIPRSEKVSDQSESDRFKMLDLDESKENKFKMLLNESVTDYTTTAISRIVVQKVIDLIKNHEPVQEYILFTKDEIPGNDRFDVDFLCVKVKESEEISKIYSSGATSYLNSVQVENSLKKTLEKVINFLREVPENIGNLAGLAEFCDKYLSESATSDILDILGIYLNTRDESLLKKVELFLVSYYETEKKSLMKNIVINYAPYVPKNLIDEILDNPKRFLKTVEVEIIIPPELYGKSKNGKYRTLALAVEFVVELKSTLTHELTHTRQHKRNEENIDDPKNFKDFKDVTEYLKEPKEVEAFVADCYKKAKMLKRNLYDVMKDLFYAEKDRIEIERKENKKNPYYMVTEQQILSAWDEWVEFAKKKYPQVKSPEDVSKRSQLDMIDLDEVWRRIKNA